MVSATFHGRRAVQIENDLLRITATIEGGHIAEILHKQTAVNPLWVPPWPTMEPAQYDRDHHPQYGTGNDAQLLAGILGHNVCLDTFGEPSPEEAAAGMPVHGEGPVAVYEASAIVNGMSLAATLERSQLRFQRDIRLLPGSDVLVCSETLDNLSRTDRPIAWTQHVTIGPPYLERGRTEFRVSATHSRVADSDFNDNMGGQQPGVEFKWPFCPMKDGKATDLRVFTAEPISGGFTTHLMDSAREQSYFLTWSPTSRVLFGYVWKRTDFPWMARWEENHLRQQPPWNGKGLTCGMEFGVSPMGESRRKMVERGSLFDTPGYRWIPASGRLNARYCAFITTSESIPDSASWDGEYSIHLVPA